MQVHRSSPEIQPSRIVIFAIWSPATSKVKADRPLACVERQSSTAPSDVKASRKRCSSWALTASKNKATGSGSVHLVPRIAVVGDAT